MIPPMNATATTLTDTMEEAAESTLDFSEILLTYQDRVYNQTFRMLGNREDAEETTQDIFLSVYGALDNFRGDSKLTTWIYRITSNECISRLRKKQLCRVLEGSASACRRLPTSVSLRFHLPTPAAGHRDSKPDPRCRPYFCRMSDLVCRRTPR